MHPYKRVILLPSHAGGKVTRVAGSGGAEVAVQDKTGTVPSDSGRGARAASSSNGAAPPEALAAGRNNPGSAHTRAYYIPWCNLTAIT